MKRSLLSAVLVLLVALLVGLFFWLRTPAPRANDDAQASSEPKTAEHDASALLLATTEPRSEPAREIVPEPTTNAAPVIATPATAPTPARFDKSARGTAHLIVQDHFGAPIANADVRLIGLRSKREPGSHWGLDEAEASVGRSAADGTVTISFPVWLDVDLDVGFLTLSVRHPEFVTLDLDMFEVKSEPQVVVLERGAFLIVSGYIGSKENVIRDVVVRLTDEVRVPSETWLPIKDGRLSNATVPPGEHGLYLAHRAADGALYYSDATYFTLAASEQKELHLELHPAITLAGVLDRSVPRPIRDGSVIVNLHLGSRQGTAKTMRLFTAAVEEDGTFELADLPPGAGQIIGMCEGWVSKEVPEARVAHSDTTKDADAGNTELEPQSIDTSHAGVFELLMEPAATLVADIRDPEGKPIADATISLWPNVVWRIGYSQIFMDRSYEAVSDEKGRAIVTNLPPGECSFGVRHERWEIAQNEQGHRYGRIELKSGERASVTVELQPTKHD